MDTIKCFINKHYSALRLQFSHHRKIFGKNTVMQDFMARSMSIFLQLDHLFFEGFALDMSCKLSPRLSLLTQLSLIILAIIVSRLQFTSTSPHKAVVLKNRTLVYSMHLFQCRCAFIFSAYIIKPIDKSLVPFGSGRQCLLIKGEL